jgi:hypothetical protein
MNPPRSHLALAVLASASLYWVWQLSGTPRASGPPRGPIDWVVVGLLCLAVAWHLLQLGRRLHRLGGGKAVWHLQRTLLFWIIGLMNTAWIRPEDVGSWKFWVGAALLVIAVIDTIALLRQEFAAAPATAPDPGPPS